jgi:tetratricopeptide (TPR) repeat protein
LCGRLPLALRVAGAKLRRPDMSLERYLLQLQNERTRLEALRKEGDPDLDVQAALNLTYKDLHTETQARFRALGVFPAPFEAGALAAIWAWDGEEELSAANETALESLLEACLLDYRDDEAAYALHDLTRLYAQSLLLAQEDEARRAAQRHAEHYLQQGSQADDLVQGAGILEGLRRFDRLWPHLGAAWERMSGKAPGWPAPEAPQPWLVNFTSSMMNALVLRVSWRQRIPYLQASLFAAREIGDRHGEGAAAGALGIAYRKLGDPRRAIELHEQHLLVARESGDRCGEGNALGNLGNAYLDLGEPRRAIELNEQRLVIAREIGDKLSEGIALGTLANAYHDLGEQRRAIEFNEQRLFIAREISDRRGESMALCNLGVAHGELGEPRHAIEFYEQALVIDREIGDRGGEGTALANTGIAWQELGEPQKARTCWEQAQAIYEAIESPNAAQVRRWLAELDAPGAPTG